MCGKNQHIQLKKKKASEKKMILIFLIVVFIFGCILFSILYALGGTFTQCNLENSIQIFENNKNVSDIIITFTTMPNRLQSKSFVKAVSCMLEQTLRPKEIRLNIPYIAKRTNTKYTIPQWLQELKQITIVRCEEDYGPATKYIPSLEHFNVLDPDQKLLIYDDDSFMPVDLVENFQRLSNQYPNMCFTSEGRRVKQNKNNQFDMRNVVTKQNLFGILISFNNPPLQTCEKMPIINVDVAYGYTGILIKPKFVKLTELMNYSLMPKEAFFVDDVTLSGHLLKNNCRIAVAKGLSVGKVSFIAILETWWSKITKKPSGEALATTANLAFSNDDKMHYFYKDQWGKFY